MNNVIVVGAQWGDEGKGKIVDWLSERADIVVRFQGGHNAGHTLVIDGVTYKLSLLPSGVVRPGKLSLIGNGVVVDPWALLAEIEQLATQNVTVTPHTLRIADNAALILPIHAVIDRLREATRGSLHIGTTGRGIGPAYEDKVARRAIRLCDLAEPATLIAKLDALMAHHNALLRGLGEAAIDPGTILDALTRIAERILPFADRVWQTLDTARRHGKRILFEGAQGAMLDVDHGTYPYVTSSNTMAGQAALGAGLGLGGAGYVLGILKAYATRVGSGPFPSELHDAVGERIGEIGREFGVVTGRKRRCGWFDAVMARQAAKIGSIEGMALTKLDVLDSFPEIKLCTGYRLAGETLDYFPAGMAAQAACEPIYECFEGWQHTTQGARRWADLPAMAIKYIRRIEELIEVPVTLVSTSPKRDDVILVRDPFGY